MMQIEEFSCGKCNATRVIYLDSVFYHYLHKELKLSAIYRVSFCKTQRSRKFKFILTPTRCDLIDYKWNDRVIEMTQERCELDHALSWLSTLGGAFSALGDYFERCALIAGKISVNQLKLALRLGDPTIASRCRLYYGLSLIQQQRFKLAKFIIYSEYKRAKEATVLDHRLLRMCKGIWSKLQYEHNMDRSRKKLKQIDINT